ncbi:glycerophosphodiester phosphodiesterase [Candidatus Peregrinibacteria bacterium]|nr:glycerophosphodiester phosphodiesterase [Candidatus Peregrinibacteria bacterium]
MEDKGEQLRTAFNEATRAMDMIIEGTGDRRERQVERIALLQEKIGKIRGLIREYLVLVEGPDKQEEKEKVPDDIEIIGHRGCGYEPENTPRSFREALKQNVDRIELDVWRCASGELVVIHDETLDRTTNGTGRVTNFTLTELQSFDAGMGEKIPTLEQVLSIVGGKAKFCIELKESGLTDYVAGLIEQCVKTGECSYEDFMVSSFNHRELIKLRQRIPQIKIGAILYGMPLRISDLKENISTDSLHVSTEFISQELIDEAHSHEMTVFAYTVNNADSFRSVLNMGIDGICSDYPDRFEH